MCNLKEIELEIEILRKKMHEIIENGIDLVSEEAVTLSQHLDRVLTKYHQLKETE